MNKIRPYHQVPDAIIRRAEWNANGKDNCQKKTNEHKRKEEEEEKKRNNKSSLIGQ
jgi:hypothetical protein